MRLDIKMNAGEARRRIAAGQVKGNGIATYLDGNLGKFVAGQPDRLPSEHFGHHALVAQATQKTLQRLTRIEVAQWTILQGMQRGEWLSDAMRLRREEEATHR